MEGLFARLAYSTGDERRGAPARHRVPIDGSLRNGTATLKSAAALYKKFREGGQRQDEEKLTMIDYSWVPWFGELVRKIAENDRDYLIGKAKAVNWGKDRDEVPLLKYGDENIDPLSFLYFLAQKNTANQFQPVFQSVRKVFDITSELPSKQPFIPTPPALAPVLFHDGESFRPDLFWGLFEQAAQMEPKIRPEDFDAALQMKNVKIKKLTQTLFIANPYYFFPADDTNKALPQPEFQKDVRSYDEYVARLAAIKRMFPGCEPYEINTFIDTQSRPKTRLVTRETQFFHINSDIKADGTDRWETFKENNIVYTGGELENDPRHLADRGSIDTIKKPKRGDIIVVRFGGSEGRGIGVVEQNGYDPDGWSSDRSISVCWINKKSERLSRSRGEGSFKSIQRNTGNYQVFKEAYKVSFELIEQLQSSSERSSKPDGETGSKMEEDDMAESGISSPSLNTILFGPPGTGKTWETVSHAVATIDGKEPSKLAAPKERDAAKKRFNELREDGQIEFVTFHQNYAYEDFIEGIRPVLDGSELAYELHEGIFKQICKRACKDPDKKYVLIIDEINRGNIAKIFGELITLIESSKRLGGEDATTVTLPYSQEAFGIPSNLHILGTMNTADRGIALLDTALRRRFHFIEKMPNPELVEKDIEGVNGPELLKAMNSRIKAKLDREHQIGHTYLLGKTTIKELAEAFQHQIMPLLQEYFYDDWEKIQHVLGGNGSPFIQGDGRGESLGENEDDRLMLELLPHGRPQWQQAESYQQIYAQADQGK